LGNQGILTHASNYTLILPYHHSNLFFAITILQIGFCGEIPRTAPSMSYNNHDILPNRIGICQEQNPIKTKFFQNIPAFPVFWANTPLRQESAIGLFRPLVIWIDSNANLPVLTPKTGSIRSAAAKFVENSRFML
jgi:hypothetical protein